MADTPATENRDVVGSLANTATPEETEAATARINTALSHAGLGDAPVLANVMMNVHYRVPTTDIDTMAVTARGDGIPVLMYNPHFTLQLAETWCVLFVLYHEMLHLLYRHLEADRELHTDRRYNLACEATINRTAMSSLDSLCRGSLPLVRTHTRTGTEKVEKTGIDPQKVYKEYAAAADKHGIQKVSEKAFYLSEMTAYHELCRLPEDLPQQDQDTDCLHGGDPGDGSENANGVQLDDKTVSEVMDNALQQSLTQALRGDEKAREELLKLANATEAGNDKATKAWGLLGLGALRGETAATGEMPWWKQFLGDALATLLQPGRKISLAKKRLGVVTGMRLDPMLTHRGMRRTTVVKIFIDTSASMPDRVLSQISALVGQIPDTTVHWYMFDGAVMPLTPGGKVHGGGGTNFDNCVALIEGDLQIDGDEGSDHEADAVIMVTDGYAEKVQPADPDRWIWLITAGGDTWPEAAGMRCHVIDDFAA